MPPTKTPKHILEARGSWRAKHTRNASSPAAPQGKATCPRWFDAYSKRYWREYAPICEAMGTLTVADAAAFGELCCHLAELRHVREMIADLRKDGLASANDVSKLLRVVNSLSSISLRYLRRFGLTSDRTSLRVEIPEPKAGKLTKFTDRKQK